MTAAIRDAVVAFFTWLFDPATFIGLALQMLGWLFQGLGSFMPGQAGSTFTKLGTFMQGVPVQKLFAVGMYVMSPLVDPTVAKACLGVIINIWIQSLLLKLVFLIKGHVWSAGS